MIKDKFKYHLYLFLIVSLLFSCGKELDETVSDAILSANQLLSKSKCQEAINILEAVGRQNGNKSYLITLASGYACRGNYSEITLFTSDILKISIPSLLGGFTTFTTSDDMTSVTDSDFLDVNLAIEILAYAGGIESGATGENPTSTARQVIFGPSGSGDIDAMILYLSMVNLGRWLRFYDSPDSSGNKSGCVLNYDATHTLDIGGASLNTTLALLPSPCQAATTPGSADIGATGSYNFSNICDGVVLLNTFFDVLPNVLDNYTGGELASVTSVREALDLAVGQLVSAEPTTTSITAATNHKKCVADNTDADDEEDIQWYFVFMVEPLYTGL